MAKDKKGFLMYADQRFVFDKLPDDLAGKLIKHLFSYVNDESPKTDELIIDIAFEPIKQQLKRDLSSYNNVREKRSEAGKKSAEARKQKATKSTSVESVEQNPTKSTDSGNGTVNDKVNVKKENKIEGKPLSTPKKTLQELCLERETKFKEDVLAFSQYDETMLNDFFLYWSEPNKSKSKMLWETKPTFEIKRRLITWASKQFNNGNNGGQTNNSGVQQGAVKKERDYNSRF